MLLRRILPIGVFVVTFAAFSATLGADFVKFDDTEVLVKNSRFRGFSAENISWMFTSNLMGHYQPLTWLSYAIDYQWNGMRPLGFHLTNVLLHAASAVVFYFVARRLLRAAGRPAADASARAHDPDEIPLALAAAIAALLFSVHPLRVESVAWATERRDVLSVLLLLLSALTYLRSCQPGEPRLLSRRWYAATIALLTLSLLAKAWGMVFVGVALVLDMYPLRRLPAPSRRWFEARYRPVLVQKLPLLALGVCAAAVAGWAQRAATGNPMMTLEQWPLLGRAVQFVYGFMFYLQKTLWPTNLAPLYEIPRPLHALSTEYVAAYVVVAAIVLLVIALAVRRRGAGIIAALAIYLLFFAPVSGLAQSGPQLVADRYSYVSCMPFAVLAGGLALRFLRGASAARMAQVLGGAGALIAGLSVLTVMQTGIWKNSETFWTATWERAPGSRAAYQAGYLKSLAGDIAGAEALYRHAVQLQPDRYEALYVLGNLYKSRREYAEAERMYLEGIRSTSQNYYIRVNLANMYLDLNRPAEAVAMLKPAIAQMEELDPLSFSAKPYISLGIAQRQLGALAEARSAFEVAARYPDTEKEAREELRKLELRAATPPK